MREVLLEVMEDTGLGKASLKVERLCALLDLKRKTFDADHFLNGTTALTTRAKKDLKQQTENFGDAQTTQASVPVLGASDGRGDRGTCTQEEEAFGARGTARGTYVLKRQPVVVVAAVGPSVRLPSRGGTS